MSRPVNIKYPLFLRDIDKDCDSIGGYPIITVEDNFNIEAKPNTFYNIKNDEDNEISINFKDEEFYNIGNDKILLFTFDDVNEITHLFLQVSAYLGVSFKKDISKEGYKYKSIIDLSDSGYGTTLMYSKEYPTSGKDLEVCVSNDVVGLDNFEITLTNIVVLNEHIDTIVQFELGEDTNVYGVFIKEVENDNVKFKHKYYTYFYGRYNYVYTLEPYPNCSTVYGKIFGSEPDYEDNIDIKIYKNPIETSNYINEFIFNINSPANIIFTQTVKWHNDNIPDLTKKGVYTISIVNGVGCYTFIKVT